MNTETASRGDLVAEILILNTTLAAERREREAILEDLRTTRELLRAEVEARTEAEQAAEEGKIVLAPGTISPGEWVEVPGGFPDSPRRRAIVEAIVLTSGGSAVYVVAWWDSSGRHTAQAQFAELTRVDAPARMETPADDAPLETPGAAAFAGLPKPSLPLGPIPTKEK